MEHRGSLQLPDHHSKPSSSRPLLQPLRACCVHVRSPVGIRYSDRKMCGVQTMVHRSSARLGREGGGVSRPIPPAGIVLLAIVFVLMAGYLILIGSLYAVAPSTLGPSFRQDPEGGVRVAAFAFFGGMGA